MHTETDIRTAVAEALAALGIGMETGKIPLEFTDDFAHGDLASSVALRYAKQAGMAPKALAESIVAAIGSIPGVEKIDIAGAGFINFRFASGVFADTLREILVHPAQWGRNDLHKGQRIMVEYTDPNPFKEFHIGHLMSNAIGESIARILERSGAEVKRASYQGDVGPHVAKAIWAVRTLGLDPADVSQLGQAYAAGAAAYTSDPEAKIAIDAINAKVYDRSDPAVSEIYAAGRAASLVHFEELYRMLGTKFDCYFFESETAPRGTALVKGHPEVFEKSDGALVYRGEGEGLHTRVFLTAKGLPTYEAKDLGLLALKEGQGQLDRSFTVTAHEQSDYFAVMLAAARRIPELREIAGKTVHVSHGMMRFAEGKMSSRTGNVVSGESLLNDLASVARERAAESRSEDPESLSRHIAVAAIKYQILRQSSGKDIVFDRQQALSLEGDSGPYLQYSHARACQVLAKARAEGIVPSADEAAEPIALERLLCRFPATVERAARELEPHHVATFLTNLAALFNRWYAEVRIAGGEDAPRKVAIAAAARATLRQGLSLLGIPAPEKM